ncbi:MAG: WhiB family transcriptional regulator [Acidimicrobiia bacterium]
MATDWRARAACSGYPNAVFFPSGDAPGHNADQALAVCSVCPVAEACLDYALETNQRAGIWGGTTEDQRKSLRRKWLAGRRRSA